MFSKFKKVDTIEVPNYLSGKCNQLYMHPIDLAKSDVILPEQFKEYTNIISQLITHSPTKTGMAHLTIDQKVLHPGKSQRRPGFHVDGNFLFGWGSNHGWLTGSPGRELSADKHLEQYANDYGGTLLVTNTGGTTLLNGEYSEIPLQGGDCSHIDLTKFTRQIAAPGEVYLLNSTCIHDGPILTETVNRVLIRLTLPNNFKL